MILFKKKNKSLTNLFFVFLFIYILTLIIPAGEYERIYDAGLGRLVILPNTYRMLEKNILSMAAIAVCLVKGYIKASGIMLFLFAFSLYFSTVLEAQLLQVFFQPKAKTGGPFLFLTYVFLLSAIGGSLAGIYEELFIFIPPILSCLVFLEEKKIIGGYAVILGSCAGVAASTLNPYTVGIASKLAGESLWNVKLLLFRCLSLAIFCVIGIFHIRQYVKKTVVSWSPATAPGQYKTAITSGRPLSSIQKHIILNFFSSLIITVVLVLLKSCTMNRLSFLFLTASIINVFLLKKHNISFSVKHCFADLLPVLILIGFANAIPFIMEQARIIDTIIYFLIQHGGKNIYLSVLVMWFFHLAVNGIVISSVGHAVLLIPLMTSVADSLQISHGLVVLTYQFANGIATMIWPTKTMLICSVLKISITEWYHFIHKHVILLLFLQIILIEVACFLRL